MPQYFFRISNGKPYIHEAGEELRDDTQAWKEATRLMRDVESALEPNGHWDLDVSDAGGLVYSIKIKARTHR
jgi:hypothetical protein